MTDKLRAGVAGAGVFGGYHANKYLEVDGADLVGIFDADPQRAAKAAAERGVTPYAAFDDFLAAVDILTVATPATTHSALVEQALSAGRHVLVEKPIALDLAAADGLITLAERNELILQVGHQERYVADAFGLFERGIPNRVRSRRLNNYSGRAMDVSIVFDLMIHDLDLLAILTGTHEARIVNIEAKAVHGTLADFVRVDLQLAGGLEAELSASRLEQRPVRDLFLDYGEGSVLLDFLTRTFENTTDQPLGIDLSAATLPLAYRDPLRFGTEAFVAAVTTGQEPTVGGRAGRRALALAVEIERAANEIVRGGRP